MRGEPPGDGHTWVFLAFSNVCVCTCLYAVVKSWGASCMICACMIALNCKDVNFLLYFPIFDIYLKLQFSVYVYMRAIPTFLYAPWAYKICIYIYMYVWKRLHIYAGLCQDILMWYIYIFIYVHTGIFAITQSCLIALFKHGAWHVNIFAIYTLTWICKLV